MMCNLIATLLLLISGCSVQAIGIRGLKSSSSSSSDAHTNMAGISDGNDNDYTNAAIVRHLLQENQRLRQINEALQMSCTRQHDSGVGICSTSNIGIGIGTPSYSLLEIRQRRKQLELHVREHVVSTVATPGKSKTQFSDVTSKLKTKISSSKLKTQLSSIDLSKVKDPLAKLKAQMQAGINDLKREAKRAVGSGVFDLKKKIKSMVGKCPKECLKSICERTRQYLDKTKNKLDGSYIFENAITDVKEKGGGLSKMITGVIFNSLNWLFLKIVPDVKLVLWEKYSTHVRPQFEGAVGDLFIKYAELNIFGALQEALVDKLLPSVGEACQLLPSISFIVEIESPGYCVFIIDKVLRIPGLLGGFVKTLVDALVDSGGLPKKIGKVAKAVGKYLSAPIGELVQEHYEEVKGKLKELVDTVATHSARVKKQAEELASGDVCKDDETLACKLDNLVSLFLLIFDKRNMAANLSNFLRKKLEPVLYGSMSIDHLVKEELDMIKMDAEGVRERAIENFHSAKEKIDELLEDDVEDSSQ